MIFLRVLALILVGAGAVVATKAPVAVAQTATIGDAKRAGIVGERIDGYLGFVNDTAVDRALRRQVQEINAKRRAVYDELARDTETTTEQVARITAEKQIARAGVGEFYMNEQGRWVKKP